MTITTFKTKFWTRIEITITLYPHLGTNKTTESPKGLSTSSAVQNQLLPTPSAPPPQPKQIQTQLIQTEVGQDYEGDLTVKVMTSSGTIAVSKIQTNDKSRNSSTGSGRSHKSTTSIARHVSLWNFPSRLIDRILKKPIFVHEDVTCILNQVGWQYDTIRPGL